MSSKTLLKIATVTFSAICIERAVKSLVLMSIANKTAKLKRDLQRGNVFAHNGKIYKTGEIIEIVVVEEA